MYSVGVKRMIEDDQVDELQEPYEQNESPKDDGLVPQSATDIRQPSSCCYVARS